MKNNSSYLRLGFIVAVAWMALIGLAIDGFCGHEEGVKALFQQAMGPWHDPLAATIAGALPADITQVHETYNGRPFWTQTRKDKVTRFKCSQCHDGRTVTAENAAAVAHGDIVLDHGGAKPLSCFTCHKDNPRDQFETEKGVTIDMDHVYELCGQCHFRQKSDWIGGAHGKRLDHWAGQRVVANCTSCHNPHSPVFKKRWPATYSLPLDEP
ncbi:MAG: hypothetical protein M0036_04310 [Desulfobacteraceae bacterium]|nr:hypothetical protein [Desulfobacteraceae bacterium]